MRKVLISAVIISILLIIIITVAFYTSFPRKIDKEYTGYIFTNKNTQVKVVPIILKGKLYKGLLKSDNFIGTIKIEDEEVNIITSSTVHTDLDTTKYYYAFYVNKNNINSKGLIKQNTSVIISKDFKEIYGYTPKLWEKYGQMSIFKSQKDLKTIYDRYMKNNSV